MARRKQGSPTYRRKKIPALPSNESSEQLGYKSARELGIVHPGSYCDELKTVSHYWIEIDIVASGSLYQCKFCLNHLWLPIYHTSAERLSKLIERYGRDEGYCHYLNRHRAAKVLMAKLQYLRRLEVEIDNKRKFARVVDKVLSDREYDREEVKDES